jgi:hypothetical protein
MVTAEFEKGEELVNSKEGKGKDMLRFGSVLFIKTVPKHP